MASYAIVETGGKQYRVEKGSTLLVDRLPEKEGAVVDLRPVAFRDKKMVLGEELGKVKVEAKVTGHERGEKIRVFKYRAKKGYRKRAGHRSELTRLEVTEVKMGQRGAASSPAEKKPAAKKPAAKAKPTAKGPAAKKKPAQKKPAQKKEASDGS
jgi:large subunit ribosomal protein L21